MDDSCLTPREKEVLKDHTISDQENMKSNLRIKYCKKAETNVLQIQCTNGKEWIYLHCDTLEEEQQDMLEFLKNNPDATLHGKPGILIKDLELVQGHLINSEKGIDICLWPTQPGDKPDQVLITSR